MLLISVYSILFHLHQQVQQAGGCDELNLNGESGSRISTAEGSLSHSLKAVRMH